MRFNIHAALGLACGAGLASAVPLRRQAAYSPCANITEQYQAAVAANTTRFSVDGQLATDCLNSMPFDAERGAAFVSEVSKYLQFQSTSEWLKNPPESYQLPATDLLGGIAAIYEKANSSQYKSQYAMDLDLQQLFQSANDGHLSAGFCSMSVFAFVQHFQLVSVSEDGVALPKLYAATDLRQLVNGSQAVSDVVQINGVNATQYLEKFALTQTNQDPDAQWNDLFPTLAKDGDAASGAFYVYPGYWPGPLTTTLTFSNGSSVSEPVMASVSTGIRNFNFTDGESLFEYACIPVNTTTATTSSGNSTSPTPTQTFAPTATAGRIGYPTPLIRDPYNLISGYYLEGEYNDTAVLFVPSFETSGEDLPDWVEATFSEVASAFVNASVADGKTKMIIDVSGNGGGTILSGFDLFKLFFPDLEAYSATRMRDHPAQQLTVKSWSDLNVSDAQGYYDNSFNYAIQVNPGQNESFSSWEEFYGPDTTQGANMTSVYANFNFTIESTEEQPIRGYGGVPLNVSSRPFAAENILIVSDGYCASTCTTFVNLMTSSQFGGAKSLGFGGRPIEAPMQAIGGVRGAQSAGWTYLSDLVSLAYANAKNQTNTTDPILSQEELDLFYEIGPRNPSEFPLYLGGGNLNLRNSYDPSDLETPLQFTYQPADCKLFYTYQNIVLPGTTWPAAASAVWGNGTCVAGSTNGTASY